MDIIMWAMELLNVDYLPSVSTLKALSRDQQEAVGIRTLRYDGALGHVYYVNSLADTIAQVCFTSSPDSLTSVESSVLQEFSNPRVAPHLHFYPEDAGSALGESWKADRWRNELDPALTTPMIRLGNRDFYIHEPALLMDRTVCMPLRWFVRVEHERGQVVRRFYAKACRLQPVVHDGTVGGYLVNECDTFDVDASQLALNFPQMVATYDVDHLPDPRNIIGG